MKDRRRKIHGKFMSQMMECDGILLKSFPFQIENTFSLSNINELFLFMIVSLIIFSMFTFYKYFNTFILNIRNPSST